MAATDSSPSALDAAFIAQQKQALEALRDQRIAQASGAGDEEESLQHESVNEVRDSADSAETMAIQENDEALFRNSTERLADVRRALEKIEDGSYGLSDLSGDPIPQARLEAVPKANVTVEEKQRAE